MEWVLKEPGRRPGVAIVSASISKYTSCNRETYGSAEYDASGCMRIR